MNEYIPIDIVRKILLYFRGKKEIDELKHNKIITLMKQKDYEIGVNIELEIEKLENVEYSNQVQNLVYQVERLLSVNNIKSFYQLEKRRFALDLYDYFEKKYNFTLKDHIDTMIYKKIIYDRHISSDSQKIIKMKSCIINSMGIDKEIRDILNVDFIQIIFTRAINV